MDLKQLNVKVKADLLDRMKIAAVKAKQTLQERVAACLEAKHPAERKGKA